MKNLVKIFMMAVAVVAVSCTTDTTEEQAVKPGQVVVTLSLDGTSRTHLGEKSNNHYPLLWCEDDVVMINGVKSQGIQLLDEGRAAKFVFAEADADKVTRPFNIVYPANELSPVTDGYYPVTFAATQTYTEGTFCEGAAAMYGYGAVLEEGDTNSAVALNYLTGIIRISLTGDKTLKDIVLTSEKGAIAGDFEVNCATGELLPIEGKTSNTITVDCSGVTLGEEPTYIYVAVPAGSYGVFTVTITSTDEANNQMVARFNSDLHPVPAGVVKEFGNMKFMSNIESDPSFTGDVVIESESDLNKLARLSEFGNLEGVTSVTVAASLDMTHYSWSPIQNLPTGVVFDGGSDKGYYIKGLSASLLDAVEGVTIKNVKLTGVNITETEKFYFGALVCDAVATTISNCSVAGKIVYNNSNAIVGSTNASFGVGGMVGALTGASSVANCTSDVDLTISKYAGSCDAKAYQGVGGLIGYCNGVATTDKMSISNCTALGKITNESTNLTNVQPSVGGVVGLALKITFNTITNGKTGTDDSGDITFTKNISCSATGGVIGALKDCDIDTMTNYGDITFQGTIGYPYVGGVLGSWWTNDNKTVNSTVKSVTNYGDISIPEMNSSTGQPYFGGIIGKHAGTNVYVALSDCTNYGDISILANYRLTKANNFFLGGIVGGGEKMSFSNCDNNGALTQNGTVNTNKPTWDSSTKKFTHTSYLYVGGIAGKVGSSTFTNCDNNGPITVDTDVIYGHIAGIVGAASTTSFSNNKNLAGGDISVAGSFNLNAGICGIASSMGCAATNCSNAGDITVTATQPEGDSYTNADGETSKATGTFYVNGLAWTANYAHSDFTNSGNITFKGNGYVNVFVAGTVYTPSNVLSNIKNTGRILAEVDDLNCTLKMGGICRSSNTGTFTNCSNSGDVIFKGTSKKAVYLGGLCGDVSGACVFDGDEGFVNSGNIKMLGTTTGSANVGGIAGAATVKISSATVLKNTGLVTNHDATLGLTGYSTTTNRLGGCIGSMSSKEQSVAMVNGGNIYARWAEGAGVFTVGGIVGNNTKLLSNAVCFCDIAAIGFTESATDPIVGVGMITGAHRGDTALVANCSLGGRIATTEENGEPKYITLSKEPVGQYDALDNFYPDPNYTEFFKKIYGGTWEAASSANCDGCSYVSSLE